MTNRESFIQTWANEVATTQRVLKAVPEKNLDYRPDPKSRPALVLAGFVAGHGHVLKTLLEKGHLEGDGNMPPLKSAKDAAGMFDASLADVDKVLKATSDKSWEETQGKISAPDGSVFMSGPYAMLAWGTLFDLIHHRGQLTTYLRAMGGKVPSVYGPSGDDPGQK